VRQTERGWLSILLILIALAGPLVTSLHHHADHRHHLDCKVCQLWGVLTPADSPVVPQLVVSPESIPLEEPHPIDPAGAAPQELPRPRSPPGSSKS